VIGNVLPVFEMGMELGDTVAFLGRTGGEDGWEIN
jgi:hypothetical protein